jgi:hypothetical protein
VSVLAIDLHRDLLPFDALDCMSADSLSVSVNQCSVNP